MDNRLAAGFGIAGNIISCLVYLAPALTFYRVYKKKSTEGFQSVPYVVALFSSMLWIYYALVKQHQPFLISINSVGCFIETVYIAIYMFYAPKRAKVQTVKLLLLLNVGVFCSIFLLTFWLVQGPKRVKVLGWVCAACATCVFAAPLSIIRRVVCTKSVEYMPFSLSFSLTITAVVWFLHGLFMKDKFIYLPNTVGFILGVLQLVLYGLYKNSKPTEVTAEENPEENEVIDVVIISMASSEIHPVQGEQATQGGTNLDSQDPGQQQHTETELEIRIICTTNKALV